MKPGWHQDPSDTRRLRYFDGTRWTSATASHQSLRMSMLWPIAAVVAIVGAFGPWTANHGTAPESVGVIVGASIALVLSIRGMVDGRGCAIAALGAVVASVSAGWYLRWIAVSETQVVPSEMWGLLVAFGATSVLLLVICQQWSLWRQMDALTGPRSRR